MPAVRWEEDYLGTIAVVVAEPTVGITDVCLIASKFNESVLVYTVLKRYRVSDLCSPLSPDRLLYRAIDIDGTGRKD